MHLASQADREQRKPGLVLLAPILHSVFCNTARCKRDRFWKLQRLLIPTVTNTFALTFDHRCNIGTASFAVPLGTAAIFCDGAYCRAIWYRAFSVVYSPVRDCSTVFFYGIEAG